MFPFLMQCGNIVAVSQRRNAASAFFASAYDVDNQTHKGNNMPNYMKTADDRNTKKFIPTPKLWEEFYCQWYRPLAKSLCKYATAAESEEAVHEAFLKVLDLSANLKLSKKPEPKTEGEWRKFMYWQARGVLSNMHGKAARFEPLPDAIADMIPEKYADSLVCRPDIGSFDIALLRRAICAAVWNACRKWRDGRAKYKAVMMFMLDDCPAKEVVAAVPEVLNTNNFNQIYYRARCALAEAALQPGSVLAEMCCA